jgi:hypothetical protein
MRTLNPTAQKGAYARLLRSRGRSERRLAGKVLATLNNAAWISPIQQRLCGRYPYYNLAPKRGRQRKEFENAPRTTLSLDR